MARRASDRWVTPGVVMTALVVAGAVVVAVVGVVAYLTARGLDPQPVVELVAQVCTGVGTLGTLGLQLVGRKTAAKTERAAGTAAATLEALAADSGRHHYPDIGEPAPAVCGR